MSRWTPEKPDTGVVVWGASDDLIQFDGQVYDEVGAWDTEKVLVFPDGTVAEIHFSATGVWRINVVADGRNGPILDACPTETDDDPGFDRYTDVLHVPGNVPWVAVVSPEDVLRGGR